MPNNYTDKIKPGQKQEKCKGCGAAIYWIKTDTGKNMPINNDGTSHFSTCPNANNFRKGKANG